MAISYIGQATGTTSATLPTHQAGDLIIAFAFRDGDTTAPSLGGSFNNINTTGSNTCSSRLAYFVATGAGTSTGTWTNATSVVFLVYRGAFIGTAGTPTTGATNSFTTPAITLSDTSGSSWVVALAGHRRINQSLDSPAPTSMTNRATILDVTDQAVGHDTNAGVSSWTQKSRTLTGTASGWASHSVEVKEIRNVTQSSTFTNTSTIHSARLVNVTDAVVYDGRRKFDDGAKYGPFDQTLIPTLFTNTNTFYSGTVEIDQDIIYPPLYENINQFYGHLITSNYTITQDSIFTNTNTFYNGTVGFVIYPPHFVNTNVFYSGNIKGRNDVLQSSTFLNESQFHSIFIQKALFNSDTSNPTGLPYIDNSGGTGDIFESTSSSGTGIVYIDN